MLFDGAQRAFKEEAEISDSSHGSQTTEYCESSISKGKIP